MSSFLTEEECNRRNREPDTSGIDLVFLLLILFFTFMYIVTTVVGFFDVDDTYVSKEKYVTFETVLAPGDLVTGRMSYVGVVGNTVEFESGGRTLKYSFEEGKKIKLGEDRSMILKKISGDNLVILDKRFVRVNEFTDTAYD